MRWKDGVTIVNVPNGGYLLKIENKVKKVRPEHEYILRTIREGEKDDAALQKYIQKEEKIGEVAAGFTLAGFLIEYADFIAADTSHFEIQL